MLSVNMEAQSRRWINENIFFIECGVTRLLEELEYWVHCAVFLVLWSGVDLLVGWLVLGLAAQT